MRPVLPCDGFESWELGAVRGYKTENVTASGHVGLLLLPWGGRPPPPAASSCGNFSLTLESQLRYLFPGASESSVPSTLQAISTRSDVSSPGRRSHRLCVPPPHAAALPQGWT